MGVGRAGGGALGDVVPRGAYGRPWVAVAGMAARLRARVRAGPGAGVLGAGPCGHALGAAPRVNWLRHERGRELLEARHLPGSAGACGPAHAGHAEYDCGQGRGRGAWPLRSPALRTIAPAPPPVGPGGGDDRALGCWVRSSGAERVRCGAITAVRCGGRAIGGCGPPRPGEAGPAGRSSGRPVVGPMTAPDSAAQAPRPGEPAAGPGAAATATPPGWFTTTSPSRIAIAITIAITLPPGRLRPLPRAGAQPGVAAAVARVHQGAHGEEDDELHPGRPARPVHQVDAEADAQHRADG